MRCSPTFHRWALSAALAAVLSLVLAAGALAASPKAGKLYTGPTSASYNGFTAPVSFTVAKTGRQLLSFKWAGGGCIGLGGPGNAWTNPANNYKLGTLNVSRTGTFAVKNVKSTFTWKQGGKVLTKTTISAVNGRFKSATTATGTISFTQKLTKTCKGKVSFTATLGPAPGALHKLSPASAQSVTSNTPTLSWSASANATAYRYCLARSENGPCVGGWVSAKATHASLGALAPGSYYWQVIASSVHGTVAADNGGWFSFTVLAPHPQPKPGVWLATSFSGGNNAHIIINSISFAVSSDQANVINFTYGYQYSNYIGPGGGCSGSDSSTLDAQTPAPITDGQFSVPSTTMWTGSGSGHFQGTFDSASSAHGTADFQLGIGGPRCYFILADTQTFQWTATWQH